MLNEGGEGVEGYVYVYVCMCVLLGGGEGGRSV